MYMESSLFTWIFYHSSSNDSFSMLGATSLFVYSAIKTNGFGLDSFVSINRSCITNYSSLSSSCVPYINFLYDVMCNKALCHSDSSEVTKRGFVVDTKSPAGLSIRNKGRVLCPAALIVIKSYAVYLCLRSLSSTICYLRSPVARKISLAQETSFSGSHPRSEYFLFLTIHLCLF
jgi:hypothetical protein